MLINLWKGFSKRRNSTKRPESNPDAQLNVKLKEDTSIEAPSFILSGQQYEYNYVQALGHYYFVTNITSLANGLTQIDCTQDLLATYKEGILSSTQYVLYSSSNYDANIADARVIMKSTSQSKSKSASNYGHLSSLGVYSLTVGNDESNGIGASTTYIMDSSNLAALANYFNSEPFDAILDYIQVRYLKPFDAVIKCTWIPIQYNQVPGNAVAVKLGKDVIPDVVGKKVVGASLSHAFDIDLLYTSIHSDFRRCAPYTRMQLYIPFYGMVDINPLEFEGQITLKYNVDLITGDTTIILKAGDLPARATINFSMGVECPLSQVAMSGTGAVTSIAGVAAGVATIIGGDNAKAVLGGISAVASGVNGIASAIQPTTSVKGSMAGRSMRNNITPILLELALDTSEPSDLLAIQGRPCMKYLTLSSLSGYCQCGDASINMAGLDNDRTEINAFLNGGFFIE